MHGFDFVIYITCFDSDDWEWRIVVFMKNYRVKFILDDVEDLVYWLKDTILMLYL